MKHGLEIERKFLLKQVPLAYAKDKGLDITQIYVHLGDDRFRVRETYHHPGISYDRTYKELLRPGVYDERIEDLDADQFMGFAKQGHRILMKKRIIAPHLSDDLKWEIDVLRPPKMVVLAEIETPTEDYPLIIPSFIEEVLIMEVTHLKKFTNYALADLIPKR